MVMKCAECPVNERTCTLTANHQSGQFPYCCKVYTCQQRKRVSFGLTETYTTDGTTADPDDITVEATGHWTAKTRYIFSTCGEGTCQHKEQTVASETALSLSQCEDIQRSEGNAYITVKSCPILDQSIHHCGFLNVGDRSKKYPQCCPLYTCPPNGREKEVMRLVDHPVDFVNGECVYKGERFKNIYSTSTQCFNLTCDLDRRSVTGGICLNDKLKTWNGCRAITGIEERKGLYPKCCPELVCPHMTVRDGAPEHFLFDTPVKVDVCIYLKRYVKGTHTLSNPCEKWICHHHLGKIEVIR
ncbi:hypothetical protein V5799_014720 [Amblyomma americanum]|uniref:Single domain-containing protein n=1 Tax=Amblyomma americanum TaxID=6943 RepID=A0AAQ4E276_AMBAM